MSETPFDSLLFEARLNDENVFVYLHTVANHNSDFLWRGFVRFVADVILFTRVRQCRVVTDFAALIEIE